MNVPIPPAFRRLCVFLLGLSLAGVVRAGGPDWAQFLGPTRDGMYPGPVEPWPAGGPAALWKRDVGQGFAGPVAAGGKVILFHRLGEKEVVECLDAAAGKTLWRADYATTYVDDFGFDEGPRATPALAGGQVFTFGAQGVLHAWDLADGKKLWEVDTRAAFGADKGFFGMACSPVVEGDAVIVIVGGKGAGVVAFDRNTGKTLWKSAGDEAGYASPVAATLGGERRVLAFTRAGLCALDPRDGREVFRFPWRSRSRNSVNAATPLLIRDGADDLVFLSASYGTGAALLRYKEAGPQKIWSGDDSLSNHYATSVEHGGFLYGYHGRQEQGASLRCVELKTGKVRWNEDGFGAGTLIVTAGPAKLLLLTERGELILAPASPEGYKPAAKAQILPFEARAHPALAEGLFFARSKDKLVCVDLRKKAR